MKKRMWVSGGILIVLSLVLTLSGCPAETDDSPPAASPDVTAANSTELAAKIRDATPALGGASADDPLWVELGSGFTQTEFLGFLKEGVPLGTDELSDPLGGLFDILSEGGKYVYLDMSKTGWTGEDQDGAPAYIELYGRSSDEDLDAVNDALRPNRKYLVSIKFPPTVKKIGANLFRNHYDLKEVSFRDCSALESIGERAFRNCKNMTKIDFSGCVNLKLIDSRSFGLCPLSELPNDTLDLTSLVKLERIGDYTFYDARFKTVKFPDADAFQLGMYGFTMGGNGGESAIFTGLNNVDAAFANFIYHDQPESRYSPARPMLPVTHKSEITDGALAAKNDKVFELFHPEGLSWPRQFKAYFGYSEDDGYFQQSWLIPLKDGKDVYRGQASMTIAAPVAGAPSGTVNVYSEKNAADQYKVGAMKGGVITLTVPANLAVLDQTSGMSITIDPRDYYLTKTGAENGTGAKGVYNDSTDQWNMADVTVSSGAPVQTGNTGYWWQPWIGNNAGTYNTTNPAKFVHAKALYYQEGSAWKEIKRTGLDVYCSLSHKHDGQYYVEKHDISYVYVDQDVTLKRISRLGNYTDGQGATTYGKEQTYYEVAPANVKEWASEAWLVNHPTIALSLKKGWNQIETLSRYPGDAGGDISWRTIRKYIRVSAGIMGPYDTYVPDTAYNTYYEQEGREPPSGPRKFTDEGQQKQVPWVAQ